MTLAVVGARPHIDEERCTGRHCRQVAGGHERPVPTTLVARRRDWPWQGGGRLQTAFENTGLMTELLQPLPDDRCAHAVIVDEHQPRSLHADPLVSRLNELAAGGGGSARGAPFRDFLR